MSFGAPLLVCGVLLLLGAPYLESEGLSSHEISGRSILEPNWFLSSIVGIARGIRDRLSGVPSLGGIVHQSLDVETPEIAPIWPLTSLFGHFNFDRRSAIELLHLLLPRRELLKRIARFRRRLDPQTLTLLAGSYNRLLSRFGHELLPVGLVEALKISDTSALAAETLWSNVDRLLENNDSSLEEFLRDLLPSLLKSRRLKREIADNRDSIKSSRGGRSRKSHGSKYRNTFVSDQEPPLLRLRLDAKEIKGRREVTKKGSRSQRFLRRSSKSSLDRGGYFDYESRSGLYDDDLTRSPTAPYGKDYSYYYSTGGAPSQKASKYYESSASNKQLMTYAPEDTVFAETKGLISSYGGGGGGWGWSQKGLGSGLDPFSILGGLAFLTYLGLLFQQSLNNNMAMSMGRSEDPEELLRNPQVDVIVGRRIKEAQRNLGKRCAENPSLCQYQGLEMKNSSPRKKLIGIGIKN